MILIVNTILKYTYFLPFELKKIVSNIDIQLSWGENIEDIVYYVASTYKTFLREF